MPVVEKVSGGRVYIRALDQRFEIGDQAEVSGEQAEYLVEDRGDFTLVDGETESEDAGDETDVDGDDFEVNGWLDNDYQDRAAAVKEGGLDDHLDEIEAAETSDTVIKAVEDRRSELED